MTKFIIFNQTRSLSYSYVLPDKNIAGVFAEIKEERLLKKLVFNILHFNYIFLSIMHKVHP